MTVLIAARLVTSRASDKYSDRSTPASVRRCDQARQRFFRNPLTGVWSIGAMVALTRNSAAARIDKELGAKLRAFRLAAGLSQIDLGASMGISGTQIQKYESGSNRMAVSMMIALCHGLKLDPMAFLGDYFPQR
jgi:hypothetical protein